MTRNYKNIIGMLCFSAIVTSCKLDHKSVLLEETFPVIIEEFSDGKFHHSDTTILTIRKDNTINVHLFGLENKGGAAFIMDVSFEVYPNDNSQILIDNIPAKLIAEKQYVVANSKMNVQKYYYDVENEADEEGFYFVLDNRIVALSSAAWDLKRYYNYENSKIISALKKDTTAFFHRYENIEVFE